MNTKTLLSLAIATALTGCSPFSNDDSGNSAGAATVSTTSGNYIPGEILTATVADADGFDPNTVTYAWLSGGVATGVTTPTYTLQASDVGNSITVDVAYTDNAGTAEMFSTDLASTVTATVTNTTPNQFASITDTDGSDSGELRYEFPSGMKQGKASVTVLYPASEEETFYMTLFDTDTNNAGMIGELQMDSGNFKNRIGGSSTTIAGQTFVPGTPMDVVLTWDTTDANASVYTIEVDGVLFGTYNAENAGAEVTHLSLKLSNNSGTAATAVEVDNIEIYSDQAGTTSVFSDDFESYAVGHDLDTTPYNSSTFSAVVGGGSTTTTPVDGAGSLSISGNAMLGEVLTAIVTDPNGLNGVTIAYQWLADGVAIVGATASSYTVASSDQGKVLSFTASYTDEDGFSENSTLDTSSGGGANIPVDVAGTLTVTGTPIVGAALEAAVTDTNGLTGVTVAYQWLADGVAIAGATAAIYNVASVDQGKVISVTADYTDEDGFTDNLTIAAGAAVPTVITNTAGTVAITGIPTAGETLTATVNDADGFDATTVTYNWISGGVATGVTTQTYLLQTSDVGNTISVDVTYTDNAGASEMLGTGLASTISAPAPNLVAIITDADTNDTGELRYKLDSSDVITQGKVTLSVMYPVGETQTFYVVLFGSSTSSSKSIGEIQMDSGKFLTRQPSDSTTDLTATNFVQGTLVDVVLKWDISDVNAATYTIEIPGTANHTETFSAFTTDTSVTAIQNIQIKLSSTSGTADIATGVEVDNLVISKLEADGTYTEVFADDFDSRAVGDDLVASPYSTSGFSAIVGASSL